MPNREKIRVTPHQLKRWGLAAAMLACVGFSRYWFFRSPPQAEAYHGRIIAAAAGVPARFDAWVSLEAPVPAAAITMLRPNLTVSRKYTNLNTGEQATFLLVQCRDARDLMGHYPPVCYVANGYRSVNSAPKDWQIDGLHVEGMVYTFSSTRPEQLTSMIIYDFMILPDGHTCRDMEGVYAAARQPRNRQLGAAQLQILVDPSMPPEERDALFVTLVKANRPTIDAILAGDQL